MKKKICISAESTIDLPEELLKKYDIRTTPFHFAIKDEVYTEGEISNEELFRLADEKGVLPKTSAVNEYQFEDHFKELLEEYETIIHFSISSKASSAYDNALKASEKFKNVYVIDSLSLSTGIAIQCIKACELRDQGKDIDTILEKARLLVPLTQASIVTKTIRYLYKGGRCGLLKYIGANVLGIKPQIVLNDGNLEPKRNYRGKFEKVVTKYIEHLMSDYPNVDKELAFITYTTADEEIINTAKQLLETKGFKEIIITEAGCTVSSHTGPNTIGVIFVNKK